MAPHPYLDHNGPIAFAHRGGTSHAPENSMRAFEHAYSLGYRYLETDVHATSDGVLIAFHDDDLQRTCGVARTIATSTWEQIKQLRLEGTDPIPTLNELVHTWPDVRLNIDCKSDTTLPHLIRALHDSDIFERICIGSFSDVRLQKMRREFGDRLCTSMGPKEVAKLVARSIAKIPVPVRFDALAAQIPVRQGPLPVTTRRLVTTAHSLGIAVHVWTVDDPVEISRLLDLGVDGVMSDDTLALRDVFSARGYW